MDIIKTEAYDRKYHLSYHRFVLEFIDFVNLEKQ